MADDFLAGGDVTAGLEVVRREGTLAPGFLDWLQDEGDGRRGVLGVEGDAGLEHRADFLRASGRSGACGDRSSARRRRAWAGARCGTRSRSWRPTRTPKRRSRPDRRPWPVVERCDVRVRRSVVARVERGPSRPASPPGRARAVNQRTERVRTDFFAVPRRRSKCSLGSSFRLDPEWDAPRRRVPRLLTADAPVRVLLGLGPAC